MKPHKLVAILLICGILACAALAYRTLNPAITTATSGPAVIFQSEFKLPSYSGGVSSRFLLSDISIDGSNETPERSSSGISFTPLEFRYALVENSLIETKNLDDPPSEQDIRFGSFHAPANESRQHKIVYQIYRDELGFYLPAVDDISKIRHRFECNDEFEIMWEVDRVVSSQIFPRDVKVALATDPRDNK